MPREISDKGRIRQNRGKIDLNNPENYVPWIKARDCYGGDGTRHVLTDLYYKNRAIHLMSDIEKDVYYTLRSNENVFELFEQYPLLPLNKTEEICIKYGIKHPKHPITKKNIVMTSDFLIIVKDKDGKRKWQACAVKISTDLNDIRTREKLFVEKMYWENMNVNWGVITEQQINKNYVKNVILCKSGYTGLGKGTIYDIIKHLIILGDINVDMNTPIDLDRLVYKIQKGEIVVGRTDLFDEK